jgi:ATP-dependent Clp protease protease subunit
MGNYFEQVRQNYFEIKRTMWVVGTIDWEIAIRIIQRLSFYRTQTDCKDPITIYLSSPGGGCEAGFAVVDAIEEIKKFGVQVNTVCCGSCSSMASVILASGTKGCRYAFPSSRIMVHQAGIDLFGGKLKDIEIVHREVQNWTDAMNKIFKKQTGKNLEELKKMIEYDNYMSANEAKKIGLIDKVQTKLI